jgi:hypothetical protein
MTKQLSLSLSLLTVLALCAHLVGCSKNTETSVGESRRHVLTLAETAKQDVDELRRGLPEGARHLAQAYQAKVAPKDDLTQVRAELERARGKVQDLRVAKSTFFALVERDGTILRTDREPDTMSGKNLFSAYPALKAALDGKLVEGRGSMAEASAVRGQKDGQFVMAVPVTVGSDVQGIYATGWSWSAYAYRLENALRSEFRTNLKDVKVKEPLIYVFVVVDDAVYGAPVSPRVSAEAIQKLSPLTKATGQTVFSAPMEITGRGFGLAVIRAPSLGENVAIAVLRSET